MNKNIKLAFMVWAIDRDTLDLPLIKQWRWFKRDSQAVYDTYTDPSDELLYISSIVGQNPLDVFTDYILCYAKMHVISGIRNYGKYDELIKNYKL
jgi:hypothetical protein